MNSPTGDHGANLARFMPEFSDRIGMREKWPLPSCKEIWISDIAAEGLDSGSCGSAGLGAVNCEFLPGLGMEPEAFHRGGSGSL